MSNSCIIVAGGNGSRMGTELPKQFLLIEGIPVLMHTIRNFYDFDSSLQLILVLPEIEIINWNDLCRKYDFAISHQVIAGGDTRFQSVKNGLSLALDCNLIAVHDGVRPLVSHETLARCFKGAAENGTAIPVLPANESLREGTMSESAPVDRSRFYLVQTPQVFKASILQGSYKQAYISEFTDDASVVEHTGTSVHLVLGNRENIKITFPEDLMIAALFL
ncbi:MAG: 2-C-methyl-D-erythritol 4-phosphate cytidylyltransferase [Mariniphaga sp.]|nr:2-C-methyl-D-erythritol 4-phosphate cytidylyltransferase [Mariniphaga sp.]